MLFAILYFEFCKQNYKYDYKFVQQTPAHFDEDFSEIIKKEAEESGVDISCSVAKEPTRKARASLCKRMEDNMELVTPALFNCSNELPSVKVEKSVMAATTSLSKPDGLVCSCYHNYFCGQRLLNREIEFTFASWRQ